VTEDDRSFQVIGLSDTRPSYQVDQSYIGFISLMIFPKDVEKMLKVAFPDENILSRFMKELKEKN